MSRVEVVKPRLRADLKTYEPARVLWSSIGSVSPAEAREFAHELLAACDAADRLNATKLETGKR